MAIPMADVPVGNVCARDRDLLICPLLPTPSASPTRSSPPPSATSTTTGGPDANQVLAYDLAHAASAAATARALLDYGAKGDIEAAIACAFAADMVHDLITRLAGREQRVGRRRPRRCATPTRSSRRTATPTSSPRWPRRPAPATSTPTWSWCRTRSAPSPTTSSPRRPSTSTATNGDVPEEVIGGLAEIGAFGLSVPAEYGGYSEGGDSEYLGDGRRHRGAEPGQPRHRRLADHATRDPHPGARQGRHRGAEAASGCRSWPRPR